MRKNKKLLLASVAAMGALALGVGATSTFAWYQATATANLTTVPASDHLEAVASDYQLGAVTLTITFEAVSEGSVDPEQDVGVGNPALPTWVDSSNDYFDDVELTDNKGRTYVTPAVGVDPVDVTTSVTKSRFGVANVVFTLDSVDAAKLAAITDKSYTLTLTKDGYGKILGTSSASLTPVAANAGTNPFAHGDLAFTLTISNVGVPSLTLGGNTINMTSANSGIWKQKFYYGAAPKDETSATLDTTDAHSGDNLKVTVS